MPNFSDHPGYYFVAATLLPLASFLLVFLYCGAWALARRYQGGSERRGDEPGGLFAALDAPSLRRVPAFIALGGIALAFVMSLIGFVTLNAEQWKYEHEIHESERKIKLAEERLKALPDEIAVAGLELKTNQGEE